MAAVKVGVLGGTFDPPHVGHLVLAEEARVRLGLTRVVWVPAGDPWRKSGAAVSTPEHRLAMVRLAVAGNPAFETSTLETDRSGPSFTVDTLAALHDAEPASELYFIVGADALEDLPNWREPARVIELATLAVAARGGAKPQAADLDARLPGLGKRVVWVEMPRIDIQATELRERVASGLSVRYFVPEPVETYIGTHRLYV
jgi:nicotinate-nucleotide adenylyltransferase